MKKLLLNSACAMLALLSISACDKKNKAELLIGDWEATSAVKSTGENLVYTQGDYQQFLSLSFSENTITWTRGATTADTSHLDTPIPGNYAWKNDKLDPVTLYKPNNTATGSAEVSFPTNNNLRMTFHLTDLDGTYSIDIEAERK